MNIYRITWKMKSEEELPFVSEEACKDWVRSYELDSGDQCYEIVFVQPYCELISRYDQLIINLENDIKRLEEKAEEVRIDLMDQHNVNSVLQDELEGVRIQLSCENYDNEELRYELRGLKNKLEEAETEIYELKYLTEG